MREALKFSWPIIGHENIKRFLKTGLSNRSLAHAYLFHGPEKVGKTTTAEIFAKSILCDHYKEYSSLASVLDAPDIVEPLPCGQCESCQQFDKGLYADYYLLQREVNEKTGDKKLNISVGQIRDLQEKISKRSFLNSYKIVIIKEAELMTKEAANSLLKTLEEPTSKTVIILITNAKELILETILSRCQIFKFLPITKEAIYDYLIERGAKRNEALELSGLSQGRPTVALRFIESTTAFVEYKEEIEKWLSLFAKNTIERFKFVDNLLKNKPSTDKLIKELNEFSGLVRDLLIVDKVSVNLLGHRYLDQELNKIVSSRTENNLLITMKKIEETKKYLKQNINAKLALEQLIINI